MSTDGKAIFWKLSTEELINDDKKLKPLLELSLHQSGINALVFLFIYLFTYNLIFFQKYN